MDIETLTLGVSNEFLWGNVCSLKDHPSAALCPVSCLLSALVPWAAASRKPLVCSAFAVLLLPALRSPRTQLHTLNPSSLFRQQVLLGLNYSLTLNYFLQASGSFGAAAVSGLR